MNILLGIIIGLVISILNVLLYRTKAIEKVERAVTKVLSHNATIIDPVNPVDRVDLN